MTSEENLRRSQIQMRLGGMGIIINVLLAAGKVTMGILSGAGSITADGVNNISDVLSSLITWITGHIARKPGDRKHPYGHGRAEYIGTLLVGVTIVLMGWELLTTGVRSVFQPIPLVFHPAMMILLPVSIAIKLAMSIYFTQVGKRDQIPALLATGADCLSDVFATSAVFLGLLLSKYTGWQMDGILSVGVSLLVLRAGWTVCKDMVDALLGGGDNQETAAEISRRIMTYPGILGVHDLLIHDYGPGRTIASIHAEVSARENLVAIHHIIDQAERDIGEALQLDLVIHLDPVERDDPETEELLRQLEQYLQSIGPGIVLHDFRKTQACDGSCLTFDLEVPPTFQQEQALAEGVQAFLRELDPCCRCTLRVNRQLYDLCP